MEVRPRGYLTDRSTAAASDPIHPRLSTAFRTVYTMINCHAEVSYLYKTECQAIQKGRIGSHCRRTGSSPSTLARRPRKWLSASSISPLKWYVYGGIIPANMVITSTPWLTVLLCPISSPR